MLLVTMFIATTEIKLEHLASAALFEESLNIEQYWLFSHCYVK